ncbi:MAG: TatD family hydrolase [Acidiferrobacterales bacterium]
MQLVDSHCHINFEPLVADLDGVLLRASDNGVTHLLCVGVNLEDLPQVMELSRAHNYVFASAGVHPNEREGREPSEDDLVTLAGDPRVVAVGETGLDYYRSHGELGWQQERFRRHIRAARTAAKPLIVHMRDAASDTLRIMREESAGEVGGVMHCFTSTWDVAKAAMDLGFYISFSGIVTFKNAEALRAVASQVPNDRLLVETDSPYLAPVPYRGKTNEPAFVRYVADQLAAVRSLTVEALAEQTTANFFALFKHAQPVSAPC